jgi:hypothetical protein
MSAEQELIHAARCGIDSDGNQRYDKLRKSIISGLSWLEGHSKSLPLKLSYFGFYLISMWDHLVLYEFVK